MLFLLNFRTDCEVESDIQSGFITSPGYPICYPDDTNWCSNITAPPGMVVKLTVHNFQTTDFGSCTSDLLTLYDSYIFISALFAGLSYRL